MQVESFDQGIIGRAENFFWDVQKIKIDFQKNQEAYLYFDILQDVVVSFCRNDYFKGLSDGGKLEQAFRKISSVMRLTEEEKALRCIAPGVIEVCNFLALCTFLNSSRRIKGLTDKQFVLRNSRRDFQNPDSPYYRIPSLKEADIETLRKHRLRLFSARPVHIERKWNAIPKDAEHEWRFYYVLQAEELDVQDVSKRLKNLYSEINTACQFGRDNDEVWKAYNKFKSKLKKIKYEEYLKLQKAAICHILKNKEYYGINLYRIEKLMRPYIVGKEVKRLERCTSREEEKETLLKTVWLDNICFPGVYEDLFLLSLGETLRYADVFSQYIKRCLIEICLILDKLVEEGVWGDRWEDLFRNTSNELAEKVLYDPERMDFSTTKHSQKNFSRILHAGVWVEICAACNWGIDPEKLMI